MLIFYDSHNVNNLSIVICKLWYTETVELYGRHSNTGHILPDVPVSLGIQFHRCARNGVEPEIYLTGLVKRSVSGKRRAQICQLKLENTAPGAIRTQTA